MDPPIKLFGQTIAFTSSASSQDDTLDGIGATSSGAWEELSSSPQEGVENGAESGVKSELVHTEGPSGCFPEPSSSGSNGADEDKIPSSPREVYVRPLSEASKGIVSEGTEDVDAEDAGLRHGEELNGESVGGKGAKMPKRPDKAVACPRCHSLETKFCYYNNYNVNQPRHFCKHCQRYWTAGGTLRNVPVGAGRRKNKHGSVVPPRQNPDMGLVRSDEPDVAAPMLVGKGVPLAVPLQVPVVQTMLGGSLPCSPKSIIRVPGSGSSSDGVAPMQYSMRVPSLEATYILTSAESVKPSDTGGLAGTLPPVPTPAFSDVASCAIEVDGSGGWPSKDGSACSTGSGHGQAGSTLLRSVKGESGAAPRHIADGDVTAAWSGAGPPGGVHGGAAAAAATGSYGFFNGGWPYGYNVGWRGGAAFCTGGVASVGNALPPPTPANVAAAWSGAAAAGNMWTGMPWPMHGLSWSPTGWGPPPPPWSMAPWGMGAGAMGAAGAPGTALGMPPAVPGGACGPSALPTPISCPTGGTAGGGPLGKYPRPFEGGTVDGTVWAPKSLRMADPEEALRSSVWRILGVGGSHPDPAPATTFKAFQQKPESKKISDGIHQTMQTTLHANPAAMYRSMYFQESN